MTFNSSSSILITGGTGGTGSFGKVFIAETFRVYTDIQHLVIYSRNEIKRWEVLEGIDTVTRTAALNQVAGE